MLSTLRDGEIEGGARRRVKEPTGLTEEQRKAEIIKSKIGENNSDLLDKFMGFGRSRATKNRNTMLEIIRKRIEGTFDTRRERASSSPSRSPIR